MCICYKHIICVSVINIPNAIIAVIINLHYYTRQIIFTGHYWTFLDITGHCHIKMFDFLSYLSSLMSNDSPECSISKIGYLHD